MAVLAGVIAIEPVVAAHNAAGVAFFDGDFKGQQIKLAQGTLVDLAIAAHAVGFLLVANKVFYGGYNFLALGSQRTLGQQLASQNRVFAEVLKEAAAARFPRKISAAAKAHSKTLSSQFDGHLHGIVIGELAVPTCCQRNGGGKRGAVLRVASRASCRVHYIQVRNIQAGHACNISRAAAGAGIHGVLGNDELQLLIECHLFN